MNHFIPNIIAVRAKDIQLTRDEDFAGEVKNICKIENWMPEYYENYICHYFKKKTRKCLRLIRDYYKKVARK